MKVTFEGSKGIYFDYKNFTVEAEFGGKVTLHGNLGQVKEVLQSDLEFILNWEVDELSFEELIDVLNN